MNVATPAGQPPQERDAVPRGPVYAAAGGLLLLVVGGWLVTWIADRGLSVRIGVRRDAAAVKTVPREIQMIDQTLFSAHLPSRGDWSDKQRELDSYQWVDREWGIVRIPIERAMDLIAGRDRVE